MVSSPGPAVQAQDVPYGNQFEGLQVDLSTLESHLQAQHWQAADGETRRILQSFVHANGDIYAEPVPTLIPPEVFQAIDQLWSEASDGRFGYMVQNQIWQEVRAQNPVDAAVAAKAFGDRVGWTRTTPSEDWQFVSSEWLTEPELTYSLDAPVGHLPWAGVDVAVIQNILSAQSCGSCMIDAMYLQGDRFGRYLPSLFGWADTALNLPVPQVASWDQAQLARTIDLRSLYPNSTCPIRETSSAISPDGSLLAIGSYSYERNCPEAGESALAVWNLQRGNRIITLHQGLALEAFSQGNPPQEPSTEGDRIMGDGANAVAFTPDGQYLAAGFSYGVVRLWNTDTWEQAKIFQGHDYAVRAIAISPDGQTLISASSNQTINVWNLPTGELLRTIPMDESDGIVQSLLISPDGQRLATVTHRNTIQLWNLQTGQLVRTVIDAAINTPPGIPLAFSPNGQTLATADQDNSIKLWNASNGARIITLKGHIMPLQDLAFSPDGQSLASSDGEQWRLWNLETYQTTHTGGLVQDVGHPIRPSNLGQVAFSPDGRTLATSALLQPLAQSEPIPHQGIMLWDGATGQSIEHIHDVAQFQFSPDGRFLVAIGQKVQIWQPYQSLVEGAGVAP